MCSSASRDWIIHISMILQVRVVKSSLFIQALVGLVFLLAGLML